MSAEIKAEETDLEQQAEQTGNDIRLKQMMAVSTSYQGPLPPAYMMKQYQEICPEAPEIIVREFESNSIHIRKMEELRTKEEIRQKKFGQRAALMIAYVVLGIMIWTISLKVYLLAGATCLLGVLSLARAFIIR